MTGSYTFTARGDDGVRLYLSGTKVVDGWSDHGATDFNYTTNLTAGTKYDLELHFYEHGGDAECKLQWSYPGQGKQAIPQGRLYPPTNPTYTLTVNSGSGSGSYTAGTAGQRERRHAAVGPAVRGLDREYLDPGERVGRLYDSDDALGERDDHSNLFEYRAAEAGPACARSITMTVAPATRWPIHSRARPCLPAPIPRWTSSGARVRRARR